MEIKEHIEEIMRYSKSRNMTVSTAESCTGGLIAHYITNVPGASSFFSGGVVAYSNEIKTRVLGVRKDTLEKYGAVSEDCAREMAEGVAKLFKSDFAVATTGIAGPSGGTKDKPVGLVYIGYYILGEITVERKIFTGNREEIKEKIAKRAIEELDRKMVYTLKL